MIEMLAIGWKFATSRLGMYILGTLAILVALWVIYSKIHDQGYRDALDKIKEQESGIVKDSDDARRRVDDCYASGRVWRRETGTCVDRLPGVP